jgi:hypothetical protein
MQKYLRDTLPIGNLIQPSAGPRGPSKRLFAHLKGTRSVVQHFFRIELHACGEYGLIKQRPVNRSNLIASSDSREGDNVLRVSHVFGPAANLLKNIPPDHRARWDERIPPPQFRPHNVHAVRLWKPDRAQNFILRRAFEARTRYHPNLGAPKRLGEC